MFHVHVPLALVHHMLCGLHVLYEFPGQCVFRAWCIPIGSVCTGIHVYLMLTANATDSVCPVFCGISVCCLSEACMLHSSVYSWAQSPGGLCCLGMPFPLFLAGSYSHV